MPINKQNKLSFSVNAGCLVKDLYAKVQEKLHLTYIFDFKFYFNHNLLDDHQLIAAIIPKPSIFDVFRTENVFELKKAIFLDLAHEKILFDNNRIRLEMIYN
jgi:hypothetical protein